jgi:hypothetical protein
VTVLYYVKSTQVDDANQHSAYLALPFSKYGNIKTVKGQADKPVWQ